MNAQSIAPPEPISPMRYSWARARLVLYWILFAGFTGCALGGVIRSGSWYLPGYILLAILIRPKDAKDYRPADRQRNTIAILGFLVVLGIVAGNYYSDGRRLGSAYRKGWVDAFLGGWPETIGVCLIVLCLFVSDVRFFRRLKPAWVRSEG